MTAVLILVAMAVAIALMLTRRMPTAFVLGFLAVAVALLAGAPLIGDDSVTTTVVQKGGVALAATMGAIVAGAWLGTVMDKTGIASTLIRTTVELGGDRPYAVALCVFAVGIAVGTVTGSAPAAMMVGTIGIPAMIAMGVPPVTAAGTVVVGIGAGTPLELISWQFFSDTLGIPIETVRGFQLHLFPIALVIGVAYVIIESQRKGVRHTWAAVAPPAQRAGAVSTNRRVRWYALLTPILPIVLALGLDIPIIPALLAGIAYGVLTTTRPREWTTVSFRALIGSFDTAVPPLLLFAAIGMLLAAVKLPGAVTALAPAVSSVIPVHPVWFVVVMGLLVPFCLYRGPLGVYGMGAGIATILISSGGYLPLVVLGMMASYNQTVCVSDPTSTQTVWSAGFAGVRVEQVTLSTLPYTWPIAVVGLALTSYLYL